MVGAIDIGGTKIAVAAVQEDGTILFRRSCPTAPVGGVEGAVRRMVKMLRICEDECGELFAGIGIGCTGPIDPVTGVIGEVDLLPGWNGFPLTRTLQEEFGIEVVMENDADAAALAEAECGGGRGACRFLYVTVGTGIGVALILDGHPYRGARGWHPEAGHQTIDPAGPTCYCGARGCWESLASGPAMQQWIAANATAGDRIPDGAGAREICELARGGHALAQGALAREAHYLALGLGNLITMFGPDRIALGGGVMESADLLLPPAIKEMAWLHGLVPFDPAGISRAALGGDAPLLGAARVWKYRSIELSKAQS